MATTSEQRLGLLRQRLVVAARSSFEAAVARLRARLPVLGVTAALTVIAWPVGRPAVSTGLDPSWQSGLHMAFREGSEFGRDVIYQYGPLGFVLAPRLYYSDTWALAVLATLVVSVALNYSVLRLLHQRLSIWWSLVVAIPLMLVLSRHLLVGAPLLPAVGLILAVLWAVRRFLDTSRPWHVVHTIVPGMASALLLLVKWDVGPACLVVLGYTVALCAARARGWRVAVQHVGAFAGAAIVTLVLVWVSIRQPLGALPEWMRRSFEVIPGYTAAFGIESGGAWHYAAALLIVAAVAGSIVSAPQLRRVDRATLLGLLAIISWVVFKQGFVRHDAHAVQFFAMFVFLPLAFISVWGLRQALLLALIPYVALLAIANVDVVDLVAPGPKLDAIREDAHLAVSRDARTSFIDDGRDRLRATYSVPDEILRRARGRTVHIEPWELTVAYAYPEFRWHQSPVFQAPSAFTASLDGMSAAFLSGRDRPEFVLREPGLAIDGRLARFESPAAMLQLLCRYRTVYSGQRWQLLEAAPDRCGAPRVLRNRAARFGEPVDVPASTENSLVVARFRGIDDSLFDAARNIAYKAPEVYMRSGNGVRGRFLQGHQEAMHVFSVPDCARDQLDGPNVLSFDTVELEDRSGDDQESYEVEFLRIPFSC